MSLHTDHLARCIFTLENSLERLRAAESGSIDYEIYRNAVVKGFELTLETGGKLLRRVLKQFTGSPRAVDALTFKDVFREAAKHALLAPDAVQRWFVYRENRNDTAHDYGFAFAEETLALLPGFIADARLLEAVLRARLNNADA